MQSQARLRYESHFGNRVVRCYAERPASFHQMLADAEARRPDAVALECGDRSVTYRQLSGLVERLSAGLAANGVRAGDRVALLLGNRFEFVPLCLAASRLGAVAVPMNVREAAPEILHILADSGARLLLYEDDLYPLLPDRSAAPELVCRVAFGVTGDLPYESLLEASPPAPAHVPDEEDTAVILYTSGTTGKPKGVRLTHLGVVHSSMHYAEAMNLGDDERSVVAVPLTHVTGLVALAATMLFCAGRLVVMPAFKAQEFLRLAAASGMTHTILVPAMYNLCLLQDWDGLDLSGWRVGGYGGAIMPPPTIEGLARRLSNLQLFNCYGATETTSPACIMPAGEGFARRDFVGRAVACADVAVMDDDGREVPRGQEGEVWIGGPQVADGYWNRPDATKAEFFAGYWRSGDIGVMDDDGFVRIVDRKKDVINRGGYKIYSAEVENVLLETGKLAEVAVVAKACPVLGERVHAVLVPKEGASVDFDALGAYVRERLSDYKVPETFALSDVPLPRNANGKVLKRQLKAAAPA